MTEQEQIFNKFSVLLNKLKYKRIVLYGIGSHTEYCLSRINNRNSIIGLMDAKKTGDTIFGLYVFGNDEIIGKTDVIIIIARTAVEHLIYERIKHLSEHEIKIYNVNGDDLVLKYINTDNFFQNNPYWNSSLVELKKEIELHEVISFDIFDTLIIRRIIRPHDELGFEAEKRLNVQRKDIADCLNYALELGKEVFLLSDMYFSAVQLQELLKLNGITGFKEIIVSCEYGMTKENGELYNILKMKAKSSSILHIGDNILADIENARKHGIDVYYIMSVYDMLLNSPIFEILKNVPAINDSLAIGYWAALILNSPFALCDGKGRISVKNMEICVSFFAPVVNEFIRWMVNSLNGSSKDTLVIFLARDGYIIKKIYDWIKENFKLNLPENIYFPASRDAVSNKYSLYNKNYIEYARKERVYNYKKIIVYDLATKGTIVSRLSEILNIPIDLYCFASFNINEKYDINKVHSLFGDFSYYDIPYNFLKMYELFEIMSAPPGQTQFLYIDNDLNPVYSNIINYIDWNKAIEFQDELLSYIKNYIYTNPDWLKQNPQLKTIDNILGLLKPEYSVVNDNVKSAFLFESAIENVSLTPWWDKVVW